MKLIADSGSTKTDWTLLHDSGRNVDEVFVKTALYLLACPTC